jgi:adenosylhomocysteinase
MSDIAYPKRVEAGLARIEWAGRFMPVLNRIRQRFHKERPLRTLRIGCCLHVTTETAQLVEALQAGGAEVALCASNPLSTQDDVAAALSRRGCAVYARRGEDRRTYYRHILAVLKTRPQITLDDGADLISTIHRRHRDLANGLWGATEETTTGVIRLKALAKSGKLLFPVVAVNDAQTKFLFDNRYGTGQSTVDGILRATNVLISGLTVVVCGYGWCGRGVALRFRGLGAHVIVCEVNPIRALEAVMDGYEVMPLSEASRKGDLFLTVTGMTSVVTEAAFRRMKDGVIVANSGHFNVEIDLPALRRLSRRVRVVKPQITEYTLASGNRILVLSDGRLVNLSCAEGHPAVVMDMSFSNQALAVEWLVHSQGRLTPQVYQLPETIDRRIAEMKLTSRGIRIDRLTPEQERYLATWEAGT